MSYYDFIPEEHTLGKRDARSFGIEDSSHPNEGTDIETLLDVSDIQALTGLCKPIARKLMRESGHCVTLHRHLYVLESSFFNYLHSLEVASPCSR